MAGRKMDYGRRNVYTENACGPTRAAAGVNDNWRATHGTVKPRAPYPETVAMLLVADRCPDSLRVAFQSDGKKRYVDIRKWFLAKDGKWAPTQKGARLTVDEFMEAARELETELEMEATREGR